MSTAKRSLVPCRSSSQSLVPFLPERPIPPWEYVQDKVPTAPHAIDAGSRINSAWSAWCRGTGTGHGAAFWTPEILGAWLTHIHTHTTSHAYRRQCSGARETDELHVAHFGLVVPVCVCVVLIITRGMYVHGDSRVGPGKGGGARHSHGRYRFDCASTHTQTNTQTPVRFLFPILGFCET